MFTVVSKDVSLSWTIIGKHRKEIYSALIIESTADRQAAIAQLEKTER